MRLAEPGSSRQAHVGACGRWTTLVLALTVGCGRLGYDALDYTASGNGVAGRGGLGGTGEGLGGGGTAMGAGGGGAAPVADASVGGTGPGGASTQGGGGGAGAAATGGAPAGGAPAGGAPVGGGAAGMGGGPTVDDAAPVSSVTQQGVDQSSVTWQHDVGSEANPFLVVSVSLRAYAGVRTVTVTIDGTVPMPLGSQMFTNNAFVGMYGRVATPNSTMTIVVTANQTTSILAGSRLYAGVDPASPVADPAGFIAIVGPDTSMSVTVPATIATPGARIIDTSAITTTDAMTAGPTQTVDWSQTVPPELSAGASHALGAGSDVTLEWSFPSTTGTMVANALNPAP